MIEVYYVEDDGNIAEIVKRHLEQKNCTVTVLPTVSAARAALDGHVPSVVLIDWNMPDGRGDELCQWTRARWKDLPIIFLTVRDDPGDVVSGFQNGADDYVTKPFDLDVLYSRILALLRRTGDAAKEYLSCDGIMLDRKRTQVTLDGEEVPLSPSEYELLLLLMKNKGRTVSREAILQHVWDENGNFVNDNTLTVTMKRLREKLRQPACIKTVRSIGYRMADTL